MDLEIVALANGACLVLGLRDGNSLLKAIKIRLGEIELRRGEQDVDELLSHVERHGALVVIYLRPRYRCLVFGGRNSRIALVAALPGKGGAQVKLSDEIDV